MRLPSFLVLTLLLAGCAVKRTANLVYQEAGPRIQEQRLDVYAPRKSATPRPVLIFIHGGNWNSGRKETYRLLGRNFARKGIVTVVIDYPIGPTIQYDDMARAAAESVKWATKNIHTYGGDPSRLFVSGHSAGGHLAALISLDDQYFEELSLSSPLSGVVLIDAAGLDMYSYLTEKNYGPENTYMQTFSTDPSVWKKASPRYHLEGELPPMLIYRGSQTYPSIEKSTEAFMTDYRKEVPNAHYRVLKGKKHVGMITSFFLPWYSLYTPIVRFMESPGETAPAN